MKKTRPRQLFIISLFITVIIIVLLGLSLLGLGVSCPLYKFLGLKCACCGLTRGTIALLSFNFAEALKLNYLIPLILFYIGWLYFFTAKNYIRNGIFFYKTPSKFVDITIIAILIIWMIIRNILKL